MPALGKGNECIKLLLLQASKGMSVSLFRCFSFFLAHNQRCGNSYHTSLGRDCVKKWSIS